MRVDVFLAEKLRAAFSRNMVKRLIMNKGVTVNSKLIRPSTKLLFEDIICVQIPEDKRSSLEALAMPLKIIYEDESLLVVDKPTGLSVHPGAGNINRTLVNALLNYTKKLSNLDSKRPGIVHRLDKDTSGLLVIARNSQAHLHLTGQFKEHKIEKIYLAIVEGQIQFDEGLIDAPISPNPRRRTFMKVNFACNRPARTRYRVVKRLRNFTPLEKAIEKKGTGDRKSSLTGFTVVELSPITGRTHQLRVHMKYLGHPILGDKKYSGRFKFNRLCLHAKSIRLRHPQTERILEFNSPLPNEFDEFLSQIS